VRRSSNAYLFDIDRSLLTRAPHIQDDTVRSSAQQFPEQRQAIEDRIEQVANLAEYYRRTG